MSEPTLADVLNELKKGARAFKVFEKGEEIAEFLSKADDAVREKKAELAGIEADIAKAKALLSPLAEKVKAAEDKAAAIEADAKARAASMIAAAEAKAEAIAAAAAEKDQAAEREHARKMERFAAEENRANQVASEAKADADLALARKADAEAALKQIKAGLGVS